MLLQSRDAATNNHLLAPTSGSEGHHHGNGTEDDASDAGADLDAAIAVLLDGSIAGRGLGHVGGAETRGASGARTVAANSICGGRCRGRRWGASTKTDRSCLLPVLSKGDRCNGHLRNGNCGDEVGCVSAVRDLVALRHALGVRSRHLDAVGVRDCRDGCGLRRRSGVASLRNCGRRACGRRVDWRRARSGSRNWRVWAACALTLNWNAVDGW